MDETPNTPTEPGPDDEQDVEGHNFWVDPSSARTLSNSRSKDAERQARDAQRAREAQQKKTSGR